MFFHLSNVRREVTLSNKPDFLLSYCLIVFLSCFLVFFSLTFFSYHSQVHFYEEGFVDQAKQMYTKVLDLHPDQYDPLM